MQKVNNITYRGVEKLSSFNNKTFEMYCEKKINSCKKHIKFLKKKNIIKDENQYNVCEIGSGNGRLLYSLEMEKIINQGIGIEVSKSRYLFSKKFSEYVNSKNIHIVNKNFINFKFKRNFFDIIFGIDIIFNIISANSKFEQKELLKKCKKALKRGGYLIFEVMTFNEELKKLKNKNFSKIFKFDKTDPFDKCTVDYSLSKNNILLEKTFLKRNGQQSKFVNLVSPINKKFWKNLKGWEYKIFNYWSSPNDTKEKEYIVLLKKI